MQGSSRRQRASLSPSDLACTGLRAPSIAACDHHATTLGYRRQGDQGAGRQAAGRVLLDVAMKPLPYSTSASPGDAANRIPRRVRISGGHAPWDRQKPVGAMTIHWFLLALALSLGGCTPHSPAEIEAENEAALNAFPNDYQSELLLFLRTSLNDPKFHDASVSEPVLKPIGGTVSRYVVCVRFNDQNDADAHQHVNDKLAIFFRGNVNQLIDADANQCGSVTYKPLAVPGSSLGH
jgi:hypothetical protein